MTILVIALTTITVAMVEAIAYESLPMDKTPIWLQKVHNMVWR
jgi:hypothetical protein